MTAASESQSSEFLRYYGEARPIAIQNTLIRLIYSAFNDKFIAPDEVSFSISEQGSHKTFTLHDMFSALEYLYSREPDQPLVIEMQENGNKTVISDPSEFWAWLKPYIQSKLGEDFSEDQWKSAHYAMMEGLNKEALSVARRLHMKQQLQQQNTTHPTHWEWMTASYAPESEELQTLLYQAGSFAGSQHHPLSKLRRHMSNGRAVDDEKQMRYFAEYGNHFPLPVWAASKHSMNVFSHKDSAEYSTYFKESYPEAYQAWRTHLESAGLPPEEYYPVPVHPLNIRPMQSKLAKWIAAGDILETPACIDVYANISTRSVRPRGAKAGHIKTTLPEIQLTGYPRALPYFEASSAPDITHLAKEIVKDNDGFNHTLQIIAEPYGFYFNPEKAEAGSEFAHGIYLSGLLRENPQTLGMKGDYVIPLASALGNIGKGAEGRSTTLLSDMMKANGVATAEDAKAYFRDYAKTVLTGQLGIFARYGVSLEAHQQNTYLSINNKGRLNSTIVQDIVSNTYFYSSVLKYNKKYHSLSDEVEKGLQFEPKDMEQPIQQFIHTTLKSHLIPVIAVICRDFGASRKEMMDILKEEIHTTLDQARKDHEDKLVDAAREPFRAHLHHIEQTLLQNPTLDKAMLTMLLTHSYARIGVEHPNAFAVA